MSYYEPGTLASDRYNTFAGGLTDISDNFTVFPVGVNIGGRPVIFSVLVRGQEDGTQAIDFENWLIPYDTVIKALKLEVTPLPDGQLEVRSPGLVTRINPKELRNDPELGLVFSIQELQTRFGVPAEFDINEYAIILNPPWLGQRTGRSNVTAAPLQLEGLPRIEPSNFTLTAIEQRLNATGSESSSGFGESSSLRARGELTAVGTLLFGSWYVRVNQPDFLESPTWSLAEAQYLQQTDSGDYIVGSQPTFWRSQSAGEYWGVTTIQRRGFTPPVTFGGGGFVPGQRLQASQVGRTILGEAEPGTLVRLTQGFSDRVLAEVLVDSSGIYRFEDVPIGGQSFGNYRVLLYPQGRLSAQPEIRDATFSTVPGQIPAGASATIVSAGFGRQASGFQNQNFIGELQDFRGGIAQRWGVSEDLTVGVGGIYDETARGLGELFFRPSGIPLEIAASVLSPDEEGNWDVNANVRYEPTPGISAQFNSDRFSQRLNLNWRVLPRFILLGTYNSRDGVAAGVQTGFSRRGFFTFARATLDNQNRLRWNATQRWGFLELTQQGNEIGLQSQLNYNLSQSFLNDRHSLLLSYETRNLERNDNLATVGWRYRSPARSADGSYRWETQLGYGVGSQGSGIIATAQTTVIPGLLLRGRYEGVSVTSSEANYSLELVASLNVQQGLFPGDRQSDRFRTRGGLLIQPFFDRNTNDKWDIGEELYTETADLLLILNNQPIKSSQPQIQNDRVLVRLPPGTYRLDLDPAGFPLDWQAAVDAYAVEVVAGSYTPVIIPLIRSFTLAGVITDTEGNPVAGARVEAISADGEQRLFSVTNSAGVYYLERLSQGMFTLQINGEPAQPETIRLDESSEPFQELNLRER
ncbi:carboxypeptidase-like regulatory domain-containing protein [Coleofasciculus sp. LEGE 07092]|uniref:carboxypeptidase-like regulatory domain-containing protein n=2 Tax=unclassified Coleofasciculus TaxID=2692782 RepID=UPI001D1378FD|nr:carboxypeptidase-like regulatory domain-containing protein [Coleofasciculus sp. LEGE 07092]